MFLAVIPFIADGVAKDWQQACACLERTLGSILANPEDDVRAMVICQDRPPLRIKDERYVFLETGRPRPDPHDVMEKHADKGGKTVDAFEAARELAPEYVMIVDADDLISNTLVSYVHQRPNFDAFCLKRGYQWQEGTEHFTLRRNFNLVCGTAFVWRFNERSFPAWLGKNYTKRIADQGHNLAEAAMDAEGFMVDKIHEPKAVYVTGHVNHMYGAYHQHSLKRRLKDTLLSPLRNRRLTEELKKEFGLIHEPLEPKTH